MNNECLPVIREWNIVVNYSVNLAFCEKFVWRNLSGKLMGGKWQFFDWKGIDVSFVLMRREEIFRMPFFTNINFFDWFIESPTPKELQAEPDFSIFKPLPSPNCILQNINATINFPHFPFNKENLIKAKNCIQTIFHKTQIFCSLSSFIAHNNI